MFFYTNFTVLEVEILENIEAVVRRGIKRQYEGESFWKVTKTVRAGILGQALGNKIDFWNRVGIKYGIKSANVT
jgi:hypothetical protein